MLSAAPTYGTNATLQYNTAVARTSGAEWVSPFMATGGIVIKNTGEITPSSPTVQIGNNTNVPLTINSGATLVADHMRLILHGDLTVEGNLTGSGTLDFGGTYSSQSISGYTYPGNMVLSKTSGTATFLGNVSCSGLTVNGSGGTLNLGTSLIHTISGDVNILAGTLNGGSSTVNMKGVAASWGGAPLGFSAGTGTVNFSASGDQFITGAGIFNNLSLSGSGTKRFSVIFSASGFSIGGTAMADLGLASSSCATLSLGGIGQTAGTWGGAHSSASIKNSTWFVDSSGILTVASSTCSAGYWTGITSSDWSDPTNWCSGQVPDANTDVFILPGGHQPSISTDAICRNLTIQADAIIDMIGSNTLSIKGNVQNNSLAVLGFSGGTVVLNGTDQTIGGYPLTFFNLTIANSVAVVAVGTCSL